MTNFIQDISWWIAFSDNPLNKQEALYLYKCHRQGHNKVRKIISDVTRLHLAALKIVI